MGPDGGRMAKSGIRLWQEVLHSYEVFQWLDIHYGMDEQALKSDYYYLSHIVLTC